MGELPHFISRVPEESLTKNPITPEPTREFFAFSTTFDSGAGNNKLIVAKRAGFVFEVRNIGLTCVSAAPGASQFVVQPALTIGTAGPFQMVRVNLDHSEHQYASTIFSPLSMLVDLDQFLIKVFTIGTSSGNVTFSGFYIRKEEIINKANIII